MILRNGTVYDGSGSAPSAGDVAIRGDRIAAIGDLSAAPGKTEIDVADVVMFDPQKIQDYATFKNPQRYATGMVHVLVNGIQVLRDGEHTGATPGRVVRGPG